MQSNAASSRDLTRETRILQVSEDEYHEYPLLTISQDENVIHATNLGEDEGYHHVVDDGQMNIKHGQ